MPFDLSSFPRYIGLEYSLFSAKERSLMKMGQTSGDLPFVTVILPIRNEADFIERCLRSVLSGDYAADLLEIIVVDGMSDDGTREIVRRLASEEPRLRLLDNPARIVPHAMNKGIMESKGDVVVRVDGHAEVTPDFLRLSVATLQEHPEAWCAGGPVETVNSTLIGKAVAGAMTSPIGVGNAMFRLGSYEGPVDTIAFGAYWRWVFDKIGLFDEELVRNQDDELNLRVILGGGQIYMNPRIRSSYYARASLRKLARQYYQYGFWRIRTIQKHRQPATLRQIAPLVFVLAWMVLIIASVAWTPLSWGLIGIAGAYALGLFIGAVDVARRCGLIEGCLAPIVFAILHFGYGIGSLAGLVWFILLRRSPRKTPAEYATSR